MLRLKVKSRLAVLLGNAGMTLPPGMLDRWTDAILIDPSCAEAVDRFLAMDPNDPGAVVALKRIAAGRAIVGVRGDNV